MTGALSIVGFLTSVAAGYFIQPTCARSWRWLMEPNLVEKWRLQQKQAQSAESLEWEHGKTDTDEWARNNTLHYNFFGVLGNTIHAINDAVDDALNQVVTTIETTINTAATAIEYGINTGGATHRKIRDLEQTIQAITLEPPTPNINIHAPGELLKLYAEGYNALTAEYRALQAQFEKANPYERPLLLKQLHELDQHHYEFRAQYEHVLSSTTC